MSRILFITLPLTGHVYPASAIAQQLAEAGHEVAWVGSRARLLPLIGADATVYGTGLRPYRGLADTGLQSVKSLWEDFVVPYTRFTLPSVEKAAGEYAPDLLVVDQHALAGALVAERHGLRWATLCSSSMELARPFRRLPKIEAWIRGHLATVWAKAGLPDGEAPDLLFSPYLVVALTSQALISQTLISQTLISQTLISQTLTGDLGFPDHYALVGPALAARPARAEFPWDWLDPGRAHVLVSVGTMAEANATDSTNFYSRAAAALAPLGDRLQAVVIAPPDAIGDPPEHLLVAPRVPLLELMPHLDAVLCHGGLNTICESLSCGVPLVVAPLTRDQPINAAQVVAAGAGLRVSFGRATPAQLRAALTTVLDDPGYRAAAARIRDSFAAAGGARAAAQRLAQVAAGMDLSGVAGSHT